MQDITVNKSVVKASGITTENNAWGSINVDKGSTFTLDGTNSLGENVQVWSDDANEESGSSITVNDENLTGVTGVGANLQGSSTTQMMFQSWEKHITRVQKQFTKVLPLHLMLHRQTKQYTQ